jgi:hypothetical protein
LKAKLLEESREPIRKEQEAVRERNLAATIKRRKKTQIARAIEMTIAGDVERGEGGDAEQLRLDLRERLDDWDIDDELGKSKVSEIVARICRDLGIDPDWRLWQQEAWFVEEGLEFDEDDEEAAEEEAEPEPPDRGSG